MKFSFEDRAVLLAMALVLAGALAYSVAHDGALTVLGIGSLIAGAAVMVAAASGGGQASAIALPVLGMAMVGLLIHAARGQTVAHFAVFAFLACLVVYRRWASVVAGAATIALHHLSFNYFQAWGWGPICFTEPGLGTVIEHAAYVVAEAGVLVLMAVRVNADHRAALELTALSRSLITADGSVSFASAHAPATAASTRQLQQALRHIETTIGEVRGSADSIRTASSEIATGNTDLSKRTEQTASSLQQTASAMQQLAANVQQSADVAQQARQLAAGAATVAARGGDAVAQVVSTMEAINQSSHQIADIVGTIDGIAFQTNILALNAAVEAARAGEQGRGFAVVASEVRSLANRSAEAAREIKRLIGASVERVETGSRQVDDAGRTMSEIVASVQQVNEMITQISAAAVAQSGGIGQVNGSVGDLDRMTQQNAALVEQSAAAAESLRDQADRLGGMVQRFQLAGVQA